MRFQETIELQQRFLMISDVVQLIRTYSCLVEAILDRLGRESGVVFSARKAFLGRCSDDLTIDNEGSRRIVIECGNSKDCGHSRCGRRDTGTVIKQNLPSS